MIRCRKYLSIPSPSAPSLRHISQRSMTTRTRAKANVGNDVTPAKEGVATRQRRQASDSSGPPSQTSLPPIKKAVKRTSNVDQSDDDDDKPVEIQSRAIRDGERGNHSRPSGLNTRVKKRPRKVKERENKYWAEKGGHEGAGQGRPVHEDEGDVQGLSAPNHAATEANEDGQKNVEEANRLVDPSSGDEPLPATFWEAVQRAKEAEQQQRINEALRRVETKRGKTSEGEQTRFKKIVKIPRVSGNIQVVPLNELTEEVDGRTDVPSEVLAFAQSLGASTGLATSRKRVPFVAFARAKPSTVRSKSTHKAAPRARAGENPI